MRNIGSQQLHEQIANLVEGRESLQKNADISGSMVKLGKTFNAIKPLLKMQGDYLKNFLGLQQNEDAASKESETRRYISRICEITLSEITDLIAIGEGYFSLQSKKSWGRIQTEFQKSLHTQRQRIDHSTLLQFLFKVINMRDALLREFLCSLIYRKCLLWKDLNIASEGYVHAEKKKITKAIEDYITNKKYAPTRPLFPSVGFDVRGRWALAKNEIQQQTSLGEFLKLLNWEMEDVFGIVRNYSNLNQEQRESDSINRNVEQVRSLRAEIEAAHLNCQILEKKYREATSKDEQMDVVGLKEMLQRAEEALELKEVEIKQLKYDFRDSAGQIAVLREKVKELQVDLAKVTNSEMKKLKEMEQLQTTLLQEFGRVNAKISNFGAIFEFESEGKKSLAKEIMALKAAMEKMATMLGREKNKNRDSNEEIRRLNQVILQLGRKMSQTNSEQRGS